MSSNENTLVSLNEITSLRRAGHIIRTQAPVIQQWPWENGVVLHHGSMAARLKEKMVGPSKEGDFERMVLVCFLSTFPYVVFFLTLFNRNSQMP
jgi:hypothetical protein